MALFQSQYVVQAELAAPALQQEAVDVKQEYKGEYGDDDLSEAHIRLDDVAAPHVHQIFVARQGADDVVDGRSDDAGYHVRDVRPAAVFDVSEGHTWIESEASWIPPPVVIVVRVSDIFGTSLPMWRFPSVHLMEDRTVAYEEDTARMAGSLYRVSHHRG